MVIEGAKTFVDAEKANMVVLLKKMVSIESGSYNLKGLKEMAEITGDELTKLDFKIKTFEFENAGPTIVGVKEGENPGYIILLGHMDTVFKDGTVEKNPFRIEDGRMYGPGVLDMKGGIVQIIYALQFLQRIKWQKYGIKVILVGDEESGHLDSNALEIFTREAENALCVFCCESGRISNEMVVERKGVGLLVLDVLGRSAHAGNDLVSGRNAAVELARLILLIDGLYTDPSAGLTASIGLVEAGTAVNVVPDKAKGIFDIRFNKKGSFETFVEYVNKITAEPHKDHIKTEVYHNIEYPPMVKTPQSDRLLQFVSRQSAKNGYGQLRGISVGGGADSTFFSALNIPTICSFGPIGEFAHTLKEYVMEEDFYKRTVLLADCLFNMDESIFQA